MQPSLAILFLLLLPRRQIPLLRVLLTRVLPFTVRLSVRPLETVADVTVAAAVALANPQQIRQHQLSSAATAVTAMAQKDKSGKSRFRASPREAQGTERVRLFLCSSRLQRASGLFLEKIWQ